MGLGFDPIFNAQDYPEGEFVFSKFNPGGYIVLRGENAPDFVVIVKMKLIDNKWMIDGAGVVNMPKDS